MTKTMTKDDLKNFIAGLANLTRFSAHPSMFQFSTDLKNFQHSEFFKERCTNNVVSSSLFLSYLQSKNKLASWVKAYAGSTDEQVKDLFSWCDEHELFSALIPAVMSRATLEELEKVDLKLKYDTVYEAFERICKCRGLRTELAAWEILCLSGQPEAIEAAVANYHLTRETRNAMGETALHLAVYSGSKRQVKRALELGIGMDQTTLPNAYKGEGLQEMGGGGNLTALQLAALVGLPELQKMLGGKENSAGNPQSGKSMFGLFRPDEDTPEGKSLFPYPL